MKQKFRKNVTMKLITSKSLYTVDTFTMKHAMKCYQKRMKKIFEQFRKEGIEGVEKNSE